MVPASGTGVGWVSRQRCHSRCGQSGRPNRRSALSPALLAARACAQMLGVGAGVIYARRKPVETTTKSPA